MTTPYAACLRLLDAAETALLAAGRPVPSRAFVTYENPPPRDCDQLVAWWDPLAPRTSGTISGQLQTSQAQCSLVPLLYAHVELVRCIPAAALPSPTKGTAPTAGAIDVVAATTSADEVALWSGLATFWRAGTLFTATTEPGTCRDAVIGAMTRTVEGGIVAVGWHCATVLSSLT